MHEKWLKSGFSSSKTCLIEWLSVSSFFLEKRAISPIFHYKYKSLTRPSQYLSITC
ncbi:hypothetical protein [Moraxella lacunata]|uniref:hypothetical protein n=1 Tax=Moraxella lacunata TaxID=477 RepID=UPI003EE25008